MSASDDLEARLKKLEEAYETLEFSRQAHRARLDQQYSWLRRVSLLVDGSFQEKPPHDIQTGLPTHNWGGQDHLHP